MLHAAQAEPSELHRHSNTCDPKTAATQEAASLLLFAVAAAVAAHLAEKEVGVDVVLHQVCTA